MSQSATLGVLGSLLIFGLTAGENDATAGSHKIERGTVSCKSPENPDCVPERYRLEPSEFVYEAVLRQELPASGLDVYAVRFPSPVTSPCPENNTVYAEYYRPRGDGPFPGVIILDITGGDQTLSRTIASCFAQNKIAAMFVQMAYYGPRRPAGSKLRLLSTDIPRTVDAIRQTVLDVRRATAWLESRPEIDSKRLGIHGTSLGSMIGALAAEMEPKLSRVSIALGGGGLIEAYYDDPRAAPFRKIWEGIGGTKAQAIRLLSPVDPLTYAANLKNRKVLMIAGKRDEIVPPKTTEALWRAAGEPRIIWYDCTHYGAALYFGSIMREAIQHFKSD
jgi:dienelactone hydrolase